MLKILTLSGRISSLATCRRCWWCTMTHITEVKHVAYSAVGWCFWSLWRWGPPTKVRRRPLVMLNPIQTPLELVKLSPVQGLHELRPSVSRCPCHSPRRSRSPIKPSCQTANHPSHRKSSEPRFLISSINAFCHKKWLFRLKTHFPVPRPPSSPFPVSSDYAIISHLLFHGWEVKFGIGDSNDPSLGAKHVLSSIVSYTPLLLYEIVKRAGGSCFPSEYFPCYPCKVWNAL